MAGCWNRAKAMHEAAMADGDLSFDDVVEALKEMLREGIEWAVKKASKRGGFLKNDAIAIPWPPQLRSIKRKLKKLGGRKKIDEFVRRINKAAEKAAPKALDVFVAAIMGLSLDKVDDLLHGSIDAATDYLRESTYDVLRDMFAPIIDRTLEKHAVTAVWDNMIDIYDAIPFLSDLSFDLNDYCVERALDGLFFLVAEREAELRDSPELAKSAKILAVLNNIDDLFFDSSSSDGDSSYSGSGYDSGVDYSYS